MERIVAPWGRAYVNRGTSASRAACCAARSEAPEDDGSLVVHVAPLNFIVMNLYPYNAGHVMVAPRRHVGRAWARRTPGELTEMMALARRLEERVYGRPTGPTASTWA